MESNHYLAHYKGATVPDCFNGRAADGIRTHTVRTLIPVPPTSWATAALFLRFVPIQVDAHHNVFLPLNPTVAMTRHISDRDCSNPLFTR